MLRTVASAQDKRGGRVWSRERCVVSVMRKPLDEHVFVVKYCNVHLSQHTCEQCGAHLYCPRFQPETTFAFCTVIQKRRNPPGPRPCEVVLRSLDFGACSITTCHTGVPDSTACEHEETSLRWQHWQKQLWKSTKCVVVEVKSFLRRIFQLQFW